MSPDLVAQGDLSEEIAILRRLVLASEGNPSLQRALIDTLSKVALNQDRRNLFYSSVIGRETALGFAVDCIQALTESLRAEEEVSDDLFVRVMDRVEASLSGLKLENTANDLKLLQ
ncbi:hypothetical protein [Lacipirellula parvula]|uniref:Uncharacterized protein n=1 Tax=Lacipirellula parvula TaxID=2650471 RepID=A0A5K7XGL9_9BACT|nr:hypothetical protein [Lacipirellula parvula]BBO35545.1 hypothetical protein PLANPX_5157 [Lacipirellula parvula]